MIQSAVTAAESPKGQQAIQSITATAESPKGQQTLQAVMREGKEILAQAKKLKDRLFQAQMNTQIAKGQVAKAMFEGNRAAQELARDQVKKAEEVERIAKSALDKFNKECGN